MLALPGIVLLIALVLIRPFELFPELAGFKLLHLSMGLAVSGGVLDVMMGKTKFKMTPLTVLILAFFFWCFISHARWDPGGAWWSVQGLLICVVVTLAMIHGVVDSRGLHVVAAAVLVCSLFLAAVGAQQGLSPKQCLLGDDSEFMANAVPDGRSCTKRYDCYASGERRWDKRYFCEKIGWFGLTSIANGRVRYVGKLHDPNELGLTVACAMPIAYAQRQEKKTGGRSIWALLVTLVVLLCVVFTGSRGAQVVVLAVYGFYFFTRIGFKGIIAAGVLAIPALLYGGRSGGEASESTMRRLECWEAGSWMTLHYPVFGVGHGNFLEHHVQTAHSAYLLAGGELGFVGLCLFIGIVWVAAKIPFTAWRRYAESDDPRRHWAIALLGLMGGLSIGILFLSFTYHQVFWLFIGLVGAYHSVLTRVDPAYKLKIGFKDVVAVAGVSVIMIVGFYVYTRYRLGGG